MNLSQKCQYAVRAIFELSKHFGAGPFAISMIAANQGIPQRFLENILSELKSTGLIESKRGIQGGYLLVRDPSTVTVGEIVRLIDGPQVPVKCISDKKPPCCPLKDNCVLAHLWNRAKLAVEDVYNGTSFRDLVEQEKQLRQKAALDFSI